MRADRLLSILFFLQTRGRSTTDRLAEEFEVSQRTILRDLYALRVAGFPVYTDRGPHGGCYLHDEYRNTLTQLTSDEIATLFLSSIHKPLEDLGLSNQLRAARLKLTAALPESQRAAMSRLGQRIVIDSLPWTKRARPVGFLSLLHQAAMEDRWVRVAFVRRFDVTTQRRVAPYGLVAKAGVWYLVWAGEDGHVRIDAVSDIHKATAEDERFERPSGFALDCFWQTWREEQEASRPGFDVRLRVRKDALRYVQDALGERRGVFPLPATETDEWVEIGARFSYFEEARRNLLAFGGAVEVLRPQALRVSMADFAGQIARRYRSVNPQDD
ncbi:MAG: WYL domain-containing protein [Thermotogota bacterium]